MSKNLKIFVASLCYVGFIPGAPGTWGSLAAAALFVASGLPLHLSGWLVILALELLCMWSLSDPLETFSASDPPEVVIDEAAGMWLAFLVSGSSGWIFLAITFLLFRILDVAKPFPIRRLEKLPGWRGILADDLAAGLVAGLVVRLAVVFVAA